MTNIQILPVYAIIDYVWALMELNLSMTKAQYGGRIAVIPTSQQPEFTDINKPFVVYEWSETPDGNIHPYRNGVISFAIYATEDRKINEISNLITTALGRYDETAEDINIWKQNRVYKDIRFTSLHSTTMDGPSPENTEGGRKSSIVMIRFRYVADYDYIKP